MKYYFLLLIFNYLYSSFYTFDDLHNHQNHLKRSKLMLDVDDCPQLKKPYADKLFKHAFGFPNHVSIIPLNPASKKAVKLAYSWNASCNPRINPYLPNDKRTYRLLSYLVILHKVPKCSLICENKLNFLIRGKYVDINEINKDEVPLVNYIFTIPTFNMLFSLGLDINATDSNGKNFPIKIHEDVQLYTGYESEDELVLKRHYYNHIQYIIDYFDRKNGWLFRKDNFGNTILNYIFWNGFQLLTEPRINNLIKRFKYYGVSTQLFLLSLVNHASYYFNDFEKEYSFLCKYQEKLKVLKEENNYLMDLVQEDIGISEKPVKDAISKSMKIFYDRFESKFKKRKQRFDMLERYISYLQIIFRCLVNNGINIIDEPVSDTAREYVLNKNNGAINENFFYDPQTIDALLYHWIIFNHKAFKTIPENNFIFSWIVSSKLLEYEKSDQYKERIGI